MNDTHRNRQTDLNVISISIGIQSSVRQNKCCFDGGRLLYYSYAITHTQLHPRIKAIIGDNPMKMCYILRLCVTDRGTFRFTIRCNEHKHHKNAHDTFIMVKHVDLSKVTEALHVTEPARF